LRLFQLFPANYGFHLSRNHVPSSQGTDYAGVAEAAGLSAHAECHQQNYTDYVIELVTFSMFYFALFFWLLILINRADVRSNLVLYNVLIFLTSFVIPALLGYIGSRLTKASWLRKLIRTQRHPTPTGWDYVFQQPKSYWILFHLTSGKLIGGYYDDTGFVSSYPQPQEIYVSQFWRVSDDGKFLEKVDRTAGGIIKAEEWTFIELFEA